MIVFDLECRPGQHRFEGWFASSEDFAAQQARALVSCPQCGSPDVIKAPMAPHVGRKGNQRGEVVQPPSATAAAVPAAAPPSTPPSPQALASAQAEALKSSRWVGEKFAEKARAMHYGEHAPEPIHGQTTPQEARSLIEEGVEVMPVLFPIAPPGEVH